MALNAQNAQRQAKRRRILYAEDQDSARTVTTALLQRLGYEVEAVEDGERAVECARLSNFDVILLDIEMPVMDGVTAARMIRAEATPNANAPIVALSAFLADSTERSEWRDAFDSALPKPANGNELRQAMSRALELRPAQRVPDRLHEDLKRMLPHGAWTRLAAQAASEMHSLALTLAACHELGDREAAAPAAEALRTLATNFGATGIVQRLADPKFVSPLLVSAIHAWKARETA